MDGVPHPSMTEEHWERSYSFVFELMSSARYWKGLRDSLEQSKVEEWVVKEDGGY